ncbi:MAG: alpha/beta hydrolase, partial [Sphingobacteriales bacterium]
MLLFLISILLLAVSLLALFPAPTYHLWMLAVAVTEFPLIFLLASVIIAVISRWLPNYRVATLICCLAAFIVFASPVVRAWMQSRPLVTQLDKYFPDTRTREKPFSILRMLPGQGEGALPFKTYEYTQNASGALTLDHYPSQLPGIRPCVVIIHGGSWQSGDSRQLPELNSWLAARGYHAFAINYRKAPGFKSPAAVEDALDAVAWIRRRAAALHADTNNLVLLGRSAGAQIA